MFKNEKYLKGYDINSDFLMELFIESNRSARNESIYKNYALYGGVCHMMPLYDSMPRSEKI